MGLAADPCRLEIDGAILTDGTPESRWPKRPGRLRCGDRHREGIRGLTSAWTRRCGDADTDRWEESEEEFTQP